MANSLFSTSGSATTYHQSNIQEQLLQCFCRDCFSIYRFCYLIKFGIFHACCFLFIRIITLTFNNLLNLFRTRNGHIANTSKLFMSSIYSACLLWMSWYSGNYFHHLGLYIPILCRSYIRGYISRSAGAILNKHREVSRSHTLSRAGGMPHETSVWK